MPKKIIPEMAGAKSPRQRIWAAVRQAKTFTQEDICRLSKVSDSQVKDYFKVLSKAGFVTVFASEKIKGICLRHTYQLAIDNGIEAPRIDKAGKLIKEGSNNERMWGTIRRLFNGQSFNYRELAAFASIPSSVVAEMTAKSYVYALHTAGYLECTTPAKRGQHALPARYCLKPMMNSGRRAPMIQKTKAVFDPNWDKVVWTETTGEHDE